MEIQKCLLGFLEPDRFFILESLVKYYGHDKAIFTSYTDQ